GVKAGDRVGMALERSLEAPVVTLAALKAGGSYVPLDSAYPAERLAGMLEDASISVLVVRDTVPESLAAFTGPVVSLAAQDAFDAPEVELPEVTPEAEAYVSFTSGSTGRPKGVAVPHRGVVRLTRGASYADYGPEQVWLQLAPLSFDAYPLELWPAVLNGGRMAIYPPETPSLEGLAAAMREHGVTHVWLTAGLFHQLVDEQLESLGGLRHLMTGGDVVSPAHAARVLERFPALRLMNGYGPTENTVFTTSHDVRPEDLQAGSITIGRPISNTRAYVLDGALRPVPIGVPGELCCAGDGLALGYVGRPELTAEKFVEVELFGRRERVYRSGDRVRWKDDGTLEFLGRTDAQVKIRGFRIEPGEVEAALLALDGVKQAAVIARPDAAGGKRLVAYVVGEEMAAPAELREALRSTLPDYMVPSFIVPLEALPLNPNGKVDRRALPEPDFAEAAEEYVAPRTPAEEVLAAIWAEVMGLERVGVHDDFFALGGHSLLATRVVSRIRKAFDAEVPLRALFEQPTVAGLAACIAGSEQADASPLTAIDLDGPLPLSFAQQRLWFLDQLTPGDSSYNVPLALRLRGTLDAGVLERALGEIVRRHESLRTTFAVVDDEPVQVIAPAAPLRLEVEPVADEDEAMRRVREEADAAFDLARGPLFRARLFRIAPDAHVLLVAMHHAVTDGWSIGVLMRELAALCTAFARGEPSPLAPLPLQYADYADWQRRDLAGGEMDRQLAWWKERLAGAPELLELPTDRPRSAARARAGAAHHASLSGDTFAAVRAVAAATDATPFMVLLAAYAVLLGRYAGQDDVVVGSPIAGRTHAELEPLIGFFVNTLPLRTDLSGDPTFRELVARVREATLGAYAHQELPFEKLVDELNPERSGGWSPVFQAAFAFQNFAREELRIPGVEAEPVQVSRASARFDLNLVVAERQDGLAAVLEYDAGLVDASTAEQLLAHFARVVEEAARHPDRRVRDLLLARPGEVADESTAADYPRDATLHALFRARAAETPDAVAAVFGGEALTYAQLDARSDALAGALAAAGVRAGDRVGLALERSLEVPAAILAVLKAGGSYVPLDAAYPAERLAGMMEDAAVSVVIVRDQVPESLVGFAGRVLSLADAGEGGAVDVTLPGVDVTAESEAYVMFTSGSTGRPKGVAVPHRAVVRLVRGTGFGDFGPEQVFLQLAPLSFDASTLELWAPLLNGGRLVVHPPEAPTLEGLAATLREHGVTVLWLTAGLFHQMVDEQLEALGGLRQLLAGGDVLSPAHAARVLERFPALRLTNGYGPTENTTFTCCHDVRAEDAARGSIPIGRPVAGTRVHVLDAALRPVPVGVPGELCAAGDGLALGYVGLPELTAETFVTVRVDGRAERVYRTGDRVRWREDGTLEFLGRTDAQVKIRGFRVEPGEVEAALLACAGVRQAAVVPRPDPAGGSRLVAYVVGEEMPAPGELRQALRRTLPGYMVPSAVVPMEALPLTPNGKVDRRALPEPELAAEGGYVPPRTPTEQALAAVWVEVMGLERVGAADDFFVLGGHSLLATRVLSRIRDLFGCELPLRTIFEHPTLAALAAEVVRVRAAEPAAPAEERMRSREEPPPAEREAAEGWTADAGGAAAGVEEEPWEEEALPLSFAQQRLWFLEQLEPGRSAYNVPVALRLRGALDAAVLERALEEIVRRHEVLRTTFAVEGGEPVPVIAPAATLSLEIEAAAGEDEALRRLREEAARPFDLARGPLFRAHLFRVAGDDHLLLLAMHHAVSDGWSMAVLYGELSALYAAFRRGEPSPLAELPIQYADYALWQREHLSGGELERQLGWWKERLAGAPAVLELPTDRPRSADQDHAGASERLALPPELAETLASLARREGATLFMTLLGAWQVLLARCSAQDDVVVGSPIAGRTRAETEGLIGFFVNTLALRTDLSGDPTFRELLARVRETTLQAYAHQDLPFERLVEEVQPERSLAHSPVFQAVFVLQNNEERALGLDGLRAERVELGSGEAKYDLTLGAVERPDGLHLGVFYRTALFDASTIRRLLEQYAALLRAVAAEPDARVSAVELASEEERRTLLAWSAGPETEYPREATIHALFSAQAAATPDAVALVYRGETVTYAELDARSDALARRLVAAGVKAGDRVGMALERSLEAPVVTLAALKAGGSYVPLDSAYPAERLAGMMEDASISVLVVRDQVPESLAAFTGPVVSLAEDAGEVPDVELPVVTPEAEAYVSFTSGSTGRPKGVAVPHRGVVRLSRGASYADYGSEQVWLQLAPLSFDAYPLELWPAVLNGGRVAVYPPETPSLEDLAAAMREHGVTHVWLTAGLFHQLVDEQLESLGGLRHLMTGGDVVSPPHAARVLERFPALRLMNGYGPTENATFTTTHDLRPEDLERGSLPIGKPISNTRAYVLDASLRPVPVGVPGELCCAGDGLALGSVGRPELTAEKFVQVELLGRRERVYRSGDRVRWKDDGTLEFLGRTDAQVKIRGFRIEPGEIEAALLAHPAVREAVVIARGEGEAKRL
ncbi:MAG TPA: amino acid adenylation domain-containing protein, partial [Longimicrobium sp.]|nr:amino acid adenylation domain-containing protein [Longimicrobium sp.]